MDRLLLILHNLLFVCWFVRSLVCCCFVVVYMYVCLSVCFFIHLFVCLFFHLFVCFFICLFVFSFVCLFVCLFNFCLFVEKSIFNYSFFLQASDADCLDRYVSCTRQAIPFFAVSNVGISSNL